jgi:hypothetical protein
LITQLCSCIILIDSEDSSFGSLAGGFFTSQLLTSNLKPCQGHSTL